GYRRRELLGQDLDLLKSGIHPADFHDTLDATIHRGEVWHGELCLRRRDGSLYWVETSIVPSVDEGGRPTRFLWVGSEITRLKALEAMFSAADPARRS
ncbi:MAG: PAS domain-containing protein, partial [Thiobacillaceae bacterium]